MSFVISIIVFGLAAYAAGRAWRSQEWWRSASRVPGIDRRPSRIVLELRRDCRPIVVSQSGRSTRTIEATGGKSSI